MLAHRGGVRSSLCSLISTSLLCGRNLSPSPSPFSLSPAIPDRPTTTQTRLQKPSIGQPFLSLAIPLPLPCFSPPETPRRHSRKLPPFQLRSAVIPKIPAVPQPSPLISPLAALPQLQHPDAVPLSAAAPSFSSSSGHPNHATGFALLSPAPDLRRPPPPLSYSNTLDTKRCFRTCLGVLPPSLQARILSRRRPSLLYLQKLFRGNRKKSCNPAEKDINLDYMVLLQIGPKPVKDVH